MNQNIVHVQIEIFEKIEASKIEKTNAQTKTTMIFKITGN